MAVAALQAGDTTWLNAARSECVHALLVDFSSADILLKMVALDLKLELFDEAQFFYDQFKRVDAKSPIIKFVEQSHEKQAAPSPANP